MQKKNKSMKQKKHFGRKVAVVTGAERGIGRAVVCTLAAAGMDVVIVYHKDARAGETLARELDGLGMRASAIRADVSDFASCRALANAGEKKKMHLRGVLFVF